MLFWIRELFGWMLVAAALLLIFIALTFVMNRDDPQIVEAGVVVFAALGVLRAGILLIRMSTAARICRTDTTGKT